MRLPLLAIILVPLAFALMKLPGSDSSQQQPGTFSRLTSALKDLTGGASSTTGASTGTGLGGSANPHILPIPPLRHSLPAASLASPDDGPGSVACKDLLNKLREVKVIIDKKAGTYVDTTSNYWCDRNTLLSPSCIVLPTTTAEVSIIIKSITSAKAKFATKAGGHSPNPGFSSVDKGVLISLEKLNAKSYDKENQLAIYQPGTTFGEVYDFFAQYGVTVVGARLSDVGTGLALGGGLSYLSSQYGLVCDGFRELEVVLPSGQITTASAKVNPDLFLALKGGGGNAYGIVTKYTVAARKSGTFYGGNIIYFANQTTAVLSAIRDFTALNKDPKAAIIGTYEKLPTPGMGRLWDEVCLLFLVYDGPDPGNVFEKFTSLPHIINTLKGGKTYSDIVNMSVRRAAKLAKGDNFFRNSAHLITDDTYLTAIKAWEKWSDENKKHFKLTSIDFQPVPLSLTQASKEQGGNALNLPDGPWYWLNYLITSKAGMDPETYAATQASFKAMVDSVPSAPGLPLFPNDSAFDQNPLQTFTTFKELQATKAKYDPTGYFSQHTGGWSFK